MSEEKITPPPWRVKPNDDGTYDIEAVGAWKNGSEGRTVATGITSLGNAELIASAARNRVIRAAKEEEIILRILRSIRNLDLLSRPETADSNLAKAGALAEHGIWILEVGL